jgi:aryl sulfotransferase
MEGNMRKVGEFLGYDIHDKAAWDKMVLHCTFDYMKHNAPGSAPLGGSLWEGGAETFVNKGTNGRWKDILTKDDIEMYENRAIKELGEECAQWLFTGEMK